MIKRYLTVLGISALFLQGCASHYVFMDSAPVEKRTDDLPSAVPQQNDFNFVEYSVTSSARYPLVDFMDPRRIPRSQDVNAADELPASSWYTPRLGAKNISTRELLEGPSKIGPPQAPLQVIKAKKGGNALGFVVKDKRGHKYLLKFDTSDFPGLQSAVNLITNRLFWGFGYHVPEDFVFHFKPEDLSVAPDSGVTQDAMDDILTLSASPDEEGSYRVTASLYLSGKILGPIAQRGTRKGDRNDTIPHQNLRILRALRVFSAWLDHSGIRSDNSLDVYEGEEGQGRTVHYLLDFGEALGAHGAERGRAWDGFEHFFSYQDTLRGYLRFGFPLKPWEKIGFDRQDPRGSFEAEKFELENWRETTQFMPIRHAQPDDDYWAAKVIGAVTREQLEALAEASGYPDAEYRKFVVEALLKRREKIFQKVFSRVSALESSGLKNGALQVEDRAKILLGETEVKKYRVTIFNRNHRKMEKTFWIESKNPQFEVMITPEMLSRGKGYLRVEIMSSSAGREAERPAEFHIRRSADGSARLVGIVH